MGGTATVGAAARTAARRAVAILGLAGLALATSVSAATAAETVVPQVSFPAALESGAVKVTYGGHALGFSLDGARGRVVSTGEHTAIVRRALPGVSIRYAESLTGVKEDLVLASRRARSRFTFTLRTTPGLRPILTREGQVLLVDRRRGLQMTIPAPFMFDSRRPKPRLSRAIDVDLKRAGARVYRLTLTPSRRWLAAKERQWPVTVDPSVVTGANSAAAVPPPPGIGGPGAPQCDLDDPRRPMGCREIPARTEVYYGFDPNRAQGPDPLTGNTVCQVTLEAGAPANPSGRLRFRTTVDCDNHLNKIIIDSKLVDERTQQDRPPGTTARCEMHVTGVPACGWPSYVRTPVAEVTGLTPGPYRQQARFRLRLPDYPGDPWLASSTGFPGDPADLNTCKAGEQEFTCNLSQEILLDAPGGMPPIGESLPDTRAYRCEFPEHGDNDTYDGVDVHIPATCQYNGGLPRAADMHLRGSIDKSLLFGTLPYFSGTLTINDGLNPVASEPISGYYDRMKTSSGGRWRTTGGGGDCDDFTPSCEPYEYSGGGGVFIGGAAALDRAPAPVGGT